MDLEMHDTTTNHEAVRRGRVLEYLTVGWNLVEACVAIGAGAAAGSTALVGFGIDSLIESLSGGVMLWRLKAGQEGERREKTALRLVGLSLILLGIYVAADAGWTLYSSEAPDESLVGIPVIGLPFNRTSPLSGWRRPASVCSRVVLPAPLGPSTHQVWPSCMRTSSCRHSSRPPAVRRRWRVSSVMLVASECCK